MIHVSRDNNEAFRDLQLYYILFRKKTNANRFLKMRIRLRDAYSDLYYIFYFVAVKYYILFVFLPTNLVKRFKRMSATTGPTLSGPCLVEYDIIIIIHHAYHRIFYNIM